MKMELKESGEMYLETILVLSKSQQNVRSLDIARYMHYSKPSISRAMGILRNAKYISVDDSGYITLTNSGREIAEKIYERHIVLSSVLESIGVDKETAAEDACRIEHVISDESFEALKKSLSKNKKTKKKLSVLPFFRSTGSCLCRSGLILLPPKQVRYRRISCSDGPVY